MSLTFKWILILSLLSAVNFSVFAQNWAHLGTGTDVQIRTIYGDSIDSVLYIGGMFKYADGISVNCIARWDGVKWDSLAGGTDCASPVFGIVRYKNKIYADGRFWGLDPNNHYLGRWDDSLWTQIATARNGVIMNLTVYNNDLYVMGTFDSIAGMQANGIAKWDGTNWSILNNNNWKGSGAIAIEPAAVYKGELYIGGTFNIDTLHYIARWDGNSWRQVGNGFTINSWINTMKVYNGELYVGGFFTSQAGNAGNHIQKWDGTSWSHVGGGMDLPVGQVEGLEVFNSELYATGKFLAAGGVPAEYVAKWDGNQWCGFGSSFLPGNVSELGVYNNELYIVGGFVTIDTDTFNYIAKWIGGNYTDTCGVILSVDNQYIDFSLDVRIHPNPFTNSTSMFIPEQFISKTTYLSIFDLYGREIKRLDNITSPVLTLYKENLKSGLYIYKLIGNGGLLSTGKLVIL
ncbi:MAG: T9SS type A sorting domain-containing protein [Bacteroidetes bacterium]|nr:T9SS type A sorting domain-containing protein [Bacteroidota bacterium]